MSGLRPYQAQAIADTWQHFRDGKRSVLLQMATGSGKTKTAVEGCKILASAGKNIWWMTHRRELVQQSSKAFRLAGVPHGVIIPGSDTQRDKRVHVASIGTIRNRINKLTPPDIIVWDETRHLGAKTWRAIYEQFPDSRHWGLDATPMRAGGAGLGEFYEVMVQGPSISKLMDDGFLSRYRLFTPASPDLSGIHHRHGEFVQSELGAVMDKPTVVGSAVEEYRKHAHGKRALLFAVSVEASEHAAQQFRDAGYRFRHIDGNTPIGERDAGIADLEAGRLDGITSVQIFGEGTDINGIECIIDLQPTESLMRYLQNYGRGLRPKPEPCIFLSHAGNFQRHGFVDDEREWPLEGIAKQKQAAEPSQSKECKVCFARFRIFLRKCPECGHDVPIESRVVDQIDGTLSEVDVDAERQKRQSSPEFRAQGRERTREGLAHLFTMQRAQKLGRELNPEEIQRQHRRAQHVLQARRNKHG